ncbi:amidohydrolase family protein [Phenylobacterium sp.]|uniref:metal-dependent hydrolase family protein n=1 Tax=Phenylobacterium sp. TaxID=1871053 RepID=UPI0035AF3E42
MRLLLKNVRVWDGLADDYVAEGDVLCVDGRIAEIGRVSAGADVTLDLAGRALLPGFIDAHFHAYAADVDVPRLETLPLTYLAHHAANLLRGALRRGFTTVRDAGGADWGLWRAVEDGLLQAPRIFYAGRALSQTGGHGDSRAPHVEPCGHRHVANLSQVCDGVDAIRLAARETLRQGAHQLKIFVSGGVSSPTDPIWMRQFTAEEVRAVVEEAASRRTYVMAHAYTADAITHAVRNGVRSIEHGNLLNANAATLMAGRGAFLVPTLATYDALARDGERLGLPAVSREKLAEVASQGLAAISIARRAGVKVGFGTDLLGPLHDWQLHEFSLRTAGERPIDILRSATSVNAELLHRSGDLGLIAHGARADLVAFDGEPLSDVTAITARGPAFVAKGGEVIVRPD